MDFSALPLEMKYHIFSFLSDSDIDDKTVFVSKEWRELSRRMPLHRNALVLNGNQSNTDQLANILDRHPIIRILRCNNIPYDSFNFISQTPTLRNLRTLLLTKCSFAPFSISCLVKHCPLIQIFDAFECSSDSEECIEHVTKWVHLRKLRARIAINKDWCDKRVDGYGYRCIAENCTKVEDLTVQSIDDGSLQIILKLRGRNLKKLGLVDCDAVSVESWQLLNNCRRLTHLETMYRMPISTIGLLAIKRLPLLQHLSISHAPDGCRLLFEDTTFPHLVYLQFYRSSESLDDEMLHLISKSCPKLEQFYIRGCYSRFTSKGIRHILSTCKHIKSLFFSGMVKLTYEDLQQFWIEFPKLKTIRCVKMDLKR